MTRVLVGVGILTAYVLVVVPLCILIGRAIDRADREEHTNLSLHRPPVPTVHPSALPRRCPAIRDEGRCDLDDGHLGQHIHVVVDDQQAVFWGAAA